MDGRVANTTIAGNGSAGLAGSRRVSSDYAQFFQSERKSVRFGVRLLHRLAKSYLLSGLEIEVRGGIEPPNRAFAELGLTTWLPHRTQNERATWVNFSGSARTEIQGLIPSL